MGVHWKDWWWSWNSNTLATSCEKLTHWKRLWCWEGLGAGGEGDDREWDGWMASPTQWIWVWVNPMSWWRTGKCGMLQSIGSQRVGHNWVTKLNWTESLWLWITTNWKILQEMGIPYHFTYLLRNLFAGQEATVRTGRRTMDWFKIRKGTWQGCILSPGWFNLYP